MLPWFSEEVEEPMESQQEAPPPPDNEAPDGDRRPAFDPNNIRPIMPERDKKPWILWMFLLGLLGCGMYGGYYGYCRYKVNELQYNFALQYQDLNMEILRHTTNISEADVVAAVRRMAGRAGVGIVKGALKVSIETMSEAGEEKLTYMSQRAMGILAGIPRADREFYVVGFEGDFHARFGVAGETYSARRYTWYEDKVIAKAGDGAGVEEYEPLRDEETD